MPWGKIDDQFYDHPKLKRLDPRLPRSVTRLTPRQVRELLRLAAIGLHVKAISWSNRYLMDGAISTDVAEELARDAEIGHALAAGLEAAELWDADPSAGHVIHDYAEFNKTRAEVEAERLQRSRAGRLGGIGRARNASNPPSEPPSDVPSTVLDDLPSTVPSTSLGTVPSDVPSDLPSTLSSKGSTNARARPVPSRPIEIPPNPPPSGGHGSTSGTTGVTTGSPRANGTNPRAIAAAQAEEDAAAAAAELEARAQRKQLRRQAYDRGRITEAEYDALVAADELPPDRPDGAAYATPATAADPLALGGTD